MLPCMLVKVRLLIYLNVDFGCKMDAALNCGRKVEGRFGDSVPGPGTSLASTHYK